MAFTTSQRSTLNDIEEGVIEAEEKAERQRQDEQSKQQSSLPVDHVDTVPPTPAAVPTKIHSSPSLARQQEEHVPRWSPLVALWSKERCFITAVSCCCSCAVLTIRLCLDHEPTAYLIHSIVVFLDMVLIHIFTKTIWLSVSGEIVTILCFLSFHLTKETVYELLETTILAGLCSFHLIAARNKVKQERNELEHQVQDLRHRGSLVLRNLDHVKEELAKEHEALQQPKGYHEDELSNRTHDDPSEASTLLSLPNEGNELTQELLHAGQLQEWFAGPAAEYKQKVRWLGNTIFEYFLDGSAGVMYTSFLGLIIDELISYGSGDEKYR